MSHLMPYVLPTICRLLPLLVFCTTAQCDDSAFVVAGYLPDYRATTWSEDTGPLTDLIFFGMSVSSEGKFSEKTISSQRLRKLRDVAQKSGCRLLFTVGGWNKSEGFDLLTSNKSLRQEFIVKARDFCLRYDFNGIDYDWEHPTGEQQIRALGGLLKETAAEFHSHDLLVTIAQASWQKLDHTAYDVIDRVHLMSYDHEFPQATLDKSKADVRRLIDAGCPPGKIVLGLPFYGRNAAGVAKTYAELAAGKNLNRAQSESDGFAYNGPDLIAQKTRYAEREKLGGVMIWEIAQDSNGDESLLNSLKQAISW